MADGADAADARGNSRHLVERTALGELLEAADLRHLELRVGHLAGVVELNGDLGVAFDAAYRLNRNALHRRSYPNLILACASGLRPSSRLFRKPADDLAVRRTAGKANINLHEVLRRARQLQQLRQAIAGNAPACVRAFDVDPLQQLVDRNRVAQSGHVAGDRAVAQRNQHLGALADLLQLVHVLLGADRALDQGTSTSSGNSCASTSGP